MFQIRFDSSKGIAFPASQEGSTRAACVQLEGLARRSITYPQTDMVEWFGAGADTDAKLKANIKSMLDMVTDGMRTVTFVQGSGLELKVGYNPENALQPPVLNNPTQPGVFNKPVVTRPTTPGAGSGQFFGLAFPVNATKPGESRSMGHVGSGFRIYLGQDYFRTPPNSMDRPQTVYHELTHKVLATNDHAYGANDCRHLAINNPMQARKNADNYGYFVTSLNGYVWV
jgi:Lysine-specific metallo-endopeptidase